MFAAKQRADAETLRNAQPQLWQTLLRSLVEGSRNSTPAVFAALARDIQPNLQIEIIEVADVKKSGDLEENRIPEDERLELVSSIPLLTKDGVGSLVQLAHDDFMLVAAAVLVECRSLLEQQDISDVSLGLLSAMLVYTAGGSLTSDIAGRVYEFQGHVERIHDRAEETSEVLRSQFREFKSGEEDKLTAFKRSLSEEVKLRSASTLWSDRARWHRGISALSLTAFLAVIVAALWAIAIHFQQIVELLPRDKDNHIEYVSVALIAIPAVGVGWALKVLARFIQTNSILGDDSRQRQAMTRTYLALIADKDSGVTEKDRLVMLNAIFRPLPGVQADEVAPPTILDLLKKDSRDGNLPLCPVRRGGDETLEASLMFDEQRARACHAMPCPDRNSTSTLGHQSTPRV
jgi:hypothetical protein